MVRASLPLIAFFIVVVWRIVFAGLQRRSRARRIAAPRRQHNNLLEQGLNRSERAGAGEMADNHSENSSDGLQSVDGKDRAKTYLRRIVALTGATQKRNCYVLEVGKERFHVRNRYVSRIKDLTDPQCTYEETCFYPVLEGMPKAEEIATALLQLKNNPALFDRWAVRNGLPFKADGELFNRPQ